MKILNNKFKIILVPKNRFLLSTIALTLIMPKRLL